MALKTMAKPISTRIVDYLGYGATTLAKHEDFHTLQEAAASTTSYVESYGVKTI